MSSKKLSRFVEGCTYLNPNCTELVTTNGVFDILHPGHIYTLQSARKLGKQLLVLVDSNERVKGLKGENRPVNDINYRIESLCALDCVDFVLEFNSEDELKKILDSAKPKFHVKDSTYLYKPIVEAETVLRNDGKLVFVKNIPEYSTTEIIKKIKESK